MLKSNKFASKDSMQQVLKDITDFIDDVGDTTSKSTKKRFISLQEAKADSILSRELNVVPDEAE